MFDLDLGQYHVGVRAQLHVAKMPWLIEAAPQLEWGELHWMGLSHSASAIASFAAFKAREPNDSD